MLKIIVSLSLLVLIFNQIDGFRFELTDEAKQYLARTKLSGLPESVQASLMIKQARGPGDASHWCCVNEQPITTVTETKVEHATRVVTTKTKVGYVPCGFAGTMRCSQYVTTTRTEIYTYIQTFQIPNMSACASHEVKCCAGYLLVAENCHSFSDLVANQDLFQWLHSLGLLSLPSVG